MLAYIKEKLWEIRRYTFNVKRVEFLCSRPVVTGDGFRRLADHVFDELGLSFLPRSVKPNDLIFVRAYPANLGYLFQEDSSTNPL